MKIIKRILAMLIFICLAFGGVFVYARNIEPNLMIVKKIEANGITHTQQLKIVFFSDTHFGEDFDQTKIKDIVSKINSENADVVVFGGDFLDSYARDRSKLDTKYLGVELKNIKAKYGKFAVWGNHDYGGGAVRVYNDIMESGGFKVLKNETISINELNMTITGLDDDQLGKPKMPKIDGSTDKFNLLVTHAPDVVDKYDLTSIDYVLAGHSHGGQVSIPFITPKVLPEGGQKYRKGVYNLDNSNKTSLLVTSGIGTTKIPYRFGNIPEITAVEIKKKQ